MLWREVFLAVFDDGRKGRLGEMVAKQERVQEREGGREAKKVDWKLEFVKRMMARLYIRRTCTSTASTSSGSSAPILASDDDSTVKVSESASDGDGSTLRETLETMLEVVYTALPVLAPPPALLDDYAGPPGNKSSPTIGSGPGTIFGPTLLADLGFESGSGPIHIGTAGEQSTRAAPPVPLFPPRILHRSLGQEISAEEVATDASKNMQFLEDVLKDGYPPVLVRAFMGLPVPGAPGGTGGSDVGAGGGRGQGTLMRSSLGGGGVRVRVHGFGYGYEHDGTSGKPLFMLVLNIFFTTYTRD